jgi:hypothetical protein
VGAAAPTLPIALVEQLAEPGRMFIPVGNVEKHIELIDKESNGNVGTMGVRVSRLSLFFCWIFVSYSPFDQYPLAAPTRLLGFAKVAPSTDLSEHAQKKDMSEFYFHTHS